MPPSTTRLATQAEQPPSHQATARRVPGSSPWATDRAAACTQVGLRIRDRAWHCILTIRREIAVACEHRHAELMLCRCPARGEGCGGPDPRRAEEGGGLVGNAEEPVAAQCSQGVCCTACVMACKGADVQRMWPRWVGHAAELHRVAYCIGSRLHGRLCPACKCCEGASGACVQRGRPYS